MKSFFSKECKSLLNGLLEKEPEKRLGTNGIDEIKNHPFFKSLNWKNLELKKVNPPFTPNVKDEFDLRYFDLN